MTGYLNLQGMALQAICVALRDGHVEKERVLLLRSVRVRARSTYGRVTYGRVTGGGAYHRRLSLPDKVTFTSNASTEEDHPEPHIHSSQGFRD